MSHDLKRTKCQENRLKFPDPLSLIEGRGLGTRLHNSIEEGTKFHFISHKKNIALSTRHYGRPKNGIAPVDLCTISPQDGGGMYPSRGAMQLRGNLASGSEPT